MNALRQLFRRLLKAPGFTVIAVLSMGLGIGACTSVFSIVNAVLLKSLPVPNPGELRVLKWTGQEARLRSFSGDAVTTGNRLTGDAVSPVLFETLRDQANPVADLFAFAPLDDMTVQAQAQAESSRGMVVSDNFFRGLATTPHLGRLFTPGNSDPDAAHEVVITSAAWGKHFAFDPSVVGQTVRLNGSTCTVIGVLPADFPGIRAGDEREFYVLMTAGSPFLERAVTVADHWWVRMMARLKAGASDDQLKARLDVAFAREAASQMTRPETVIQPGRTGFAVERARHEAPLTLMLIVAGIVMLAACANLAGLSLARGASRLHDMAVRSALGAGRWRLVRQSLAESCALAVMGGALGLVLALWGRKTIATLLAGGAGELRFDLSVDAVVLAFTGLIVFAAAALSGLLPALKASHVDPLDGLKARGALNAPRLLAGRFLVGSQIVLSLLLLAVGGLYLRSLAHLRNVDSGFRTDRLLVMRINPTAAGYNAGEVTAFHEAAQNSLAALPGVQNASIIMHPLLDNEQWSGGFNFPKRAQPGTDSLQTHRLVVGERFFATMGIALLQGRGLESSDNTTAPKALVVNESFVRKYLPNENPLGQVVGFLRNEWQIVGVCADVKYGNIKDAAPPTAYFSFRQFPLSLRASFIAHTAVPPLSLAPAAKRAISTISPAISITHITTQENVIDRSLGQERLFATLCGGLAGLALLLSCIGLYGLMAYNVSRRTNEIGIRMALGAKPGDVARAVVREAFIVSALGIGIGLPTALAATRLIKHQLFGVPPQDPLTFACTVALLLGVTLLAAWIPARRAARVDPMTALRSE